MKREVGRFQVDARAVGRPPCIKITDRRNDVEINGLQLEDVSDLIYALKRAQLQMVAMMIETSNPSAFLMSNDPMTN